MPRPRTTSDEEILEATGRALNQVGVGRLTLAVVAREAGLAPATLVQRFGSKRGLLLAFERYATGEARTPFIEARAGHPAPLDALQAALAALASGVRTPEELANSMSVLQLDLTDPEHRELALIHTRATQEEIAGLLADAVAAGDLVPGTDPARLARAVHVAYNGAHILWALSGEGELLEHLRDDVDHVLAPYRA
ncbi:TetR/AcrR family transcriptional regulator [Bailinhaonella thermotolerans]|uniref:TetR/AcrR family transcriptional regulator n=1 Tax=Bailinhaonella thermotolerans TaxID=1070861 RepID=A0A3A4BNR6_9ACTN|nr:TetR/AcrR family transcriptional regulator [Bailinhaonella thermotolerans]RJL32704.1 TetR/AcrR family transcriptional regulator [Bailinhaonella thermotolerans]